jgi:hypothetical protein
MTLQEEDYWAPVGADHTYTVFAGSMDVIRIQPIHPITDLVEILNTLDRKFILSVVEPCKLNPAASMCIPLTVLAEYDNSATGGDDRTASIPGTLR